MAADDVKRNGRGVGDIEAGERAGHRESRDLIAILPGQPAQAFTLRAKNEGDPVAMERCFERRAPLRSRL